MTTVAPDIISPDIQIPLFINKAEDCPIDIVLFPLFSTRELALLLITDVDTLSIDAMMAARLGAPVALPSNELAAPISPR
jgi:hypothetical protein